MVKMSNVNKGNRKRVLPPQLLLYWTAKAASGLQGLSSLFMLCFFKGNAVSHILCVTIKVPEANFIPVFQRHIWYRIFLTPSACLFGGLLYVQIWKRSSMCLSPPDLTIAKYFFSGLSGQNIQRLQNLRNAAARLLTRSERSGQVTPILAACLWSPVSFRMWRFYWSLPDDRAFAGPSFKCLLKAHFYLMAVYF